MRLVRLLGRLPQGKGKKGRRELGASAAHEVGLVGQSLAEVFEAFVHDGFDVVVRQ